jgi:carboxypeptidase C (cathepsin A)
MSQSRTVFVLVLMVFVFGVFSLPAQQKQEESQSATESSEAPAKKAKERSDSKEAREVPPKPEPEPVVSHHQIRVGSRALAYTATTGRLPIKNVEGETEAYIFFIAYTLDNPPGGAGKRPLTFSFNGGPGSSSVW